MVVERTRCRLMRLLRLDNENTCFLNQPTGLVNTRLGFGFSRRLLHDLAGNDLKFTVELGSALGQPGLVLHELQLAHLIFMDTLLQVHLGLGQSGDFGLDPGQLQFDPFQLHLCRVNGRQRPAVLRIQAFNFCLTGEYS